MLAQGRKQLSKSRTIIFLLCLITGESRTPSYMQASKVGLRIIKEQKRPQHNFLSYLLVEFTMTPCQLLNAWCVTAQACTINSKLSVYNFRVIVTLTRKRQLQQYTRAIKPSWSFYDCPWWTLPNKSSILLTLKIICCFAYSWVFRISFIMVEWEADAAPIVLHRRILSMMSDFKICLHISFPTALIW